MDLVSVISWMLCGVIGWSLLIATVWFSIKKNLLLRKMGIANGVVAGHRKDGHLYAPSIEYAVDGQTYMIYDATFVCWRRYRIGSAVKVYYDKNSPKNAFLNSFISLWLGSVVGIAIASVFAVASVVALMQ